MTTYMSKAPYIARTTVDGIATEVSARPRHYKERMKHARIYVDFDEYEARHRRHPNPEPEMFPHLDLPVGGHGKPHVYTTRGKFPEVDQAWDRANRDYAAMARECARQALVGVGLRLPERMKYSRRAGCSCPCSPGIITNGMFVPGLGDNVDIWVTVSDAWVGPRILEDQIAELAKELDSIDVRV